MKNLSLALILCVMVAIESTTIKYVKKYEKYDIPSEQLVLLVEMGKFIASFIIFFFIKIVNEKKKNDYQPILNFEEVSSDHFSNLSDISEENELETYECKIEEESNDKSSLFWYLLPAILYTISNNVTFAALSLMSPAMFNLLMNLKIPMTAFMAWMFIGYKINRNLFISFVTLFIGSGIATIKISLTDQPSFEGSLLGLLLMLVYASCSAGGAVYTEYVTRMRFSAENMFLQNMKFCVCSALANIVIIIIRQEIPYIKIEYLHFASVFVLIGNGLITAAVLKYGGSILKTYSVSVAMFLSALFTWLLFDYVLSWNYYVGAIICTIAVQLYAWEIQK